MMAASPTALLLLCALVTRHAASGVPKPVVPLSPDLPPSACLKDDLPCELDRTAFQVISELHAQLDDNKDGGVDPSEADEYFQEELRHTGTSDRSRRFYRNDQHVSVAELWARWKQSVVYNWTAEEVLDWLRHHVELPQYGASFAKQKIDGPAVPKLAMSNGHFLTNVLHVRNPVHRQKIILKAIDAILFGVPRYHHNYVKDGILTALLSISVAACWFAYTRYKRSQASLANMTQELDALSRKEESLMAVTRRLEEAERRQEDEKSEKRRLEERYRREVEEARAEASRLAGERRTTAEVIDQLQLTEKELDAVKKLLSEAERKLQAGEGACRGLTTGADLQLLLQLTYETEVMYHAVKRRDAERQLVQARENCEKVRRKRAAFMGSLRIAHSSTLDDVDRSITEAKSALEEVKTDLQERQFRWSRIEEMTGLSIMCNTGLPALRKAYSVAKSHGFSSAGSTDSGLLAPAPLIRQERVEEAEEGDGGRRANGSGLLRPDPPSSSDADLTPTNFPRPQMLRHGHSGDCSSEASSPNGEHSVHSLFDEARPQFSVDDDTSQASSSESTGGAVRSYSTDQLSALLRQREHASNSNSAAGRGESAEMHRSQSEVSNAADAAAQRRHKSRFRNILRRKKPTTPVT